MGDVGRSGGCGLMASKVQGLDKFKRALARLPEAAKAAGAASVVQGANEVAALQRNLVPVDTGALKASITVTPPGGQTPAYSQPGGQTTARPLQAIVTAGNTKVRYAAHVEFGTAPHVNGGEHAGTKNPGERAQPFFYPAWRALRTRVKSRISRTINKAIKDEFNK